MGIKNFGLIIRRVTDGVLTANYSEFSGQTWAIDASIFCYRFSHNSQSKKPNSHIDGFYKLFLRLMQFKIRPILVFDGKPPSEKQFTVDNRQKLKQKNVSKIETIKQELITLVGHNNIDSPQQLDQILFQVKGSTNEIPIKNKIDELNKANKNVIHFHPCMYDDIRLLCRLMGVVVLRANGEADALCAKLYESGQVQGIMSEDSDILLFNGGRLIRKFSWTNEIEVLELDKILLSLGITHDQFIDLAILCGTDYTAGTINGLGPLNALDYIKQGLTIEQIIEQIRNKGGKYRVPSDNVFSYQKARHLIKTACLNENETQLPPFNIYQMNCDQLTQLLVEKCRYRWITIQNHCDHLKEIYRPMCPKIKLCLKKKDTF